MHLQQCPPEVQTYLLVLDYTPGTNDAKIPYFNSPKLISRVFLGLFPWAIISQANWAFGVHTPKPTRCASLGSTHMHWLVVHSEG